MAYAAAAIDVAAKIFVPEIGAPVKIEKIRAYGAQVHVEGLTYFDALDLCEAYVEATGAMSLHAYDAAETIAGQGTVGLEWERDLQALCFIKLDTVLVAVGK